MFHLKNPKKKALALVGALIMIALMLPLFAAFEAHVINVKAHIENALDVSLAHIDFGAVFPQETLDASFTVALSESFKGTSRTVDVEYMISQELKPIPDSSPPATYEDLRPYLYKTKDASETDFDSESTASLDQSLGDLEDSWLVELYVPCISSSKCKDHGTTDCATFPCGGPRHSTCQSVPEDPPGSGEAGDWGADIWVEVLGISYFSKPRISSLTPDRGYVGTVVRIEGSGFGDAQGSSEVTFDGQVAAVSSWTDTRINARAPPGAETGPVVVTTAGGASNAANFIVWPRIITVTPNFGQVGDEVRINGTGFGTQNGASRVTLNASVATIVSWAPTQIRFSVPGGAGVGSVTLRVRTSSAVSNPYAFRVLGDQLIDTDYTTTVVGPGTAREVTPGAPTRQFPGGATPYLGVHDRDGSGDWSSSDPLVDEYPPRTGGPIPNGRIDVGDNILRLDIGVPVIGAPFTWNLNSGAQAAAIRFRFHDRNGNTRWDSGEDIVQDRNWNGIYD